MKTKKQIDQTFKDFYLPEIKKSEKNMKDLCLRRFEYNTLIDSLCKDGQITSKKASVYCIPKNFLK
jgi:hypothetical protein